MDSLQTDGSLHIKESGRSITELGNVPQSMIHIPSDSLQRNDASTSNLQLHDSISMELEHSTTTQSPDLDNRPVGDATAGADGDADWTSDDYMQDLRRVKVYELVGTRWTDRGTAFCTGDYDDEAQEARLVAKSEVNHEVLLRCTIRGNDVYQRQQDTLIVWTEPDGTDFALSFQDIEGCAEVWDFIVEVQRHLSGKVDDLSMSSPTIGPPPPLTVQSILTSGRLPEPALGIIPEIDRAIKMISRVPASKERICEYIIHEDYIKGLIEVMSQAEDLESLDDLHALCTCMQTILLLNDHAIYEYVLHDDIFFGVVGMMEYDPDFPTWKASYRDFLRDVSRFRQVIELRDETVIRKIHQTYRLQYLKDVVMARVLDDPTFNVLNSCIIFNQIDILNHIQHDSRFLEEVIAMFIADECKDSKGKGKEVAAETLTNQNSITGDDPQSASIIADEKRADVMLMLHQLCSMGKNVQLPARLALFRQLVDRGILYAVQWALGRTDKRMLNTAGEILSVLLEHDVSGVRGHVLKQVTAAEENPSSQNGPTLLADMSRMLAGAQDLALKSQMAEALRSLMDVPTGEGPGEAAKPPFIKTVARIMKEDPVTERFLEYFYKSCIDMLFKPLQDVPEFKQVTGTHLPLTRDKSNLYLYLCDLLCSFALQHSFRSHFFILSSNLSPRIATLLSSREKHLRLEANNVQRPAALRFFRICLRLNNRNLFIHLIKHDVFLPILDLTARESKRDNLLSSSCQEFFEHIRRENLRELIEHIMKKYESKVQDLCESHVVGARFKGLVRRWEMNIEPPPKPEQAPQPAPPPLRGWGQGRLMEAEEEDYFNGSDEEDPPAPGQWSRAQVLSTNGNNKRRRGRPGQQLPNVSLASWSHKDTNGAQPIPQNRPARPHNVAIPRAPPMGGLVDYDEDDDQAQPSQLPPEGPPSPTAADGESPPRSPNAAPPPQPPSVVRGRSPSPQQRVNRPTKYQPPSNPLEDASSPLLTSPSNSSMPTAPTASPSPPITLRQGEKRRRDEDDDEEGFERLTRSKRPSLGASVEKISSSDQHHANGNQLDPGAPGTKSPSSLPVSKQVGKDDGGAKRIKVKLGITSLSLASAPSETQPPPVQEISPKVGNEG